MAPPSAFRPGRSAGDSGSSRPRGGGSSTPGVALRSGRASRPPGVRQSGAGERGRAGGVGLGPRRGDRARRAICVAPLGPQSRLLDDRGPHGCPRHRRQHRDCQPDQRRLLENASRVASVGAATRRLDLTTAYICWPAERVRRPEDWGHCDIRNVFLSRVRRHARWLARVFGSRVLGRHRRGSPGRSRRRGLRRGAIRLGQLLPNPRRVGHPRTDDSAGRPCDRILVASGDDRPCVLDPRVRAARRCDTTDAGAERSSVCHRRRDAGRVLRHGRFGVAGRGRPHNRRASGCRDNQPAGQPTPLERLPYLRPSGAGRLG